MHLNNKILLVFIFPTLFLSLHQAYATTCIESVSCLPTNVMQVFQLYDIQFGSGTTLVIMALILGVIEMAIYMRTRSLAMLAVIGMYTIAAFSAIITNQYISSQYHIAIYVIAIAATSVFTIAILKLVKE